VKKTLFGFLMVGLAFIALQVETAEAQISSDHPCYDIDPSNGGRDGHACWPKGEDPSVSVEASGERNHKDQHGGMQGNHGGMQGNHGGMTGNHGGMQGNHGGMQGNHGGMQGNHGGMTGNHGGMQGNHGGMQGNHGGMQGNHGGMTGNHGGMQGNHGGMQGNYEGNGEASGEGRGIPKTDDGGWQERKDAAIAKCVKEASTSGSYNEEKDNKWCEDNYNNYL
jgi:hypothetical protein